MILLPNPPGAAAAGAVVVVVAVPKPNALGAVVLAPNEPNENPVVPLQYNRTQHVIHGMSWSWVNYKLRKTK